jgi:hypothetical protein
MLCTAAISGHVQNAVHKNNSPCRTPAIVNVAIPDGSSFAAPATTPGPKTEQSHRQPRFPFTQPISLPRRHLQRAPRNR